MIFESYGWIVRDYNQWLLNIIHGYEVRYSFHSMLLDILFMTDFEDYSGLDSDRIKDALELRNQYFEHTGNDIYAAISGKRCSFLELLIGISVRCNSVIGTPEYPVTHLYFWKMIENLGLFGCLDRNDGTFEYEKITKILQKMMLRDIDFYGNGGIFPLKMAIVDQKTAPIWSQMCAYLNENCEDII